MRAIRSASLEELLGETRPGPRPGRPPKAAPPAAPVSRARGGRLKRRSVADITNALDRIVGLLKTNKAGLRAEQIREQLHMQSKELPRPLADGLKAKKLRKKGQKRATTYFAA